MGPDYPPDEIFDFNFNSFKEWLRGKLNNRDFNKVCDSCGKGVWSIENVMTSAIFNFKDRTIKVRDECDPTVLLSCNNCDRNRACEKIT